jgi:hypothetical protein
MLKCYLDESGTSVTSPSAVVGGILLNTPNFFWLNVAWEKTLKTHGISPPLHMSEFGPHGRFKDIRHDGRRSLFTDIVKIINDNKTATIAATITTQQYQRHFSGIFTAEQASIYGICFLLLAVLQGKYAEQWKLKEDIPFLLDKGNQYMHHVREMHSFIQTEFKVVQPLNAGPL